MSTRRSFLKLLGLVPAIVAPAVVEAKPAELTIEEAVRILEKGRTVKQGLLTYCCQTGNQYLAITHAGHKWEGEEFLGFNSTKEEAIKGWLNNALLYAKDRPGILYWREKPQLDCRITEGKEDWMVYSRFVITDLDEVYSSVETINGAVWNARVKGYEAS